MQTEINLVIAAFGNNLLIKFSEKKKFYIVDETKFHAEFDLLYKKIDSASTRRGIETHIIIIFTNKTVFVISAKSQHLL